MPCGVKGVRSYDQFRFVESDQCDEYDFELDTFINLSNGKNIQLVKNTSLNTNNVIRLCSTEVVLPLQVRSRKNGDRIFVKGMDGSRKVKDIFIDCKIPINDRNKWPIVVDSADNIVWIPGIKKSKFDRRIGEECDIILKYY